MLLLNVSVAFSNFADAQRVEVVVVAYTLREEEGVGDWQVQDAYAVEKMLTHVSHKTLQD